MVSLNDSCICGLYFKVKGIFNIYNVGFFPTIFNIHICCRLHHCYLFGQKYILLFVTGVLILATNLKSASTEWWILWEPQRLDINSLFTCTTSFSHWLSRFLIEDSAFPDFRLAIISALKQFRVVLCTFIPIKLTLLSRSKNIWSIVGITKETNENVY